MVSNKSTRESERGRDTHTNRHTHTHTWHMQINIIKTRKKYFVIIHQKMIIGDHSGSSSYKRGRPRLNNNNKNNKTKLRAITTISYCRKHDSGQSICQLFILFYTHTHKNIYCTCICECVHNLLKSFNSKASDQRIFSYKYKHLPALVRARCKMW